jgi:zinc transport system substrate-binding protein
MILRRFFLTIALLAALPVTAVAASAAEPIPVVVSLLPQKYFVEAVGGDRVSVSVMVRPGHNEATYEPTPRQMTALAGARLYFSVGVPFERAWLPKVTAAHPNLVMVDTARGLTLRPLEEHGHGDGDHHHEAGELDPHVWTSPPLAARMGETIRDALSAVDPARAAAYAVDCARFVDEMQRLDADIRAALTGLSRRRFMVFHPSWGYFAATYGLTQIAIEGEGKTPSARRLAALIDAARREKVGAIFVQPQFDRRTAEAVAAEVGAKVMVADPLAADYADNLRRVAAQLAGEMR